jgi:hypothetical protein
MQGLYVGGQRRGTGLDVILSISSTSRWAVAIFEIIFEPPKLVLEALLAEEEGPAVITQPWSAGLDRGHVVVDFDEVLIELL